MSGLETFHCRDIPCFPCCKTSLAYYRERSSGWREQGRSREEYNSLWVYGLSWECLVSSVVTLCPGNQPHSSAIKTKSWAIRKYWKHLPNKHVTILRSAGNSLSRATATAAATLRRVCGWRRQRRTTLLLLRCYLQKNGYYLDTPVSSFGYLVFISYTSSRGLLFPRVCSSTKK